MNRLVAAEFLRLRRSRPVWVGAALCTVGLPVAILVMTALVSDRIGGMPRAEVTFQLLLGPGIVGAALVGVVLGTVDRESGVLRSLVSTGRPRHELFLARVPAVVGGALAIAVASWVVAVGIGTLIHQNTDPVTGAWAVRQLPSLLLTDVVMALAALGLCTAGAAGAPILGLVLALVLGVMPVLGAVDATPDWTLALMPPLAVTDLVGGTTIVGRAELPAGLAVAGLLVWTVGFGAFALQRLRRAEI